MRVLGSWLLFSYFLSLFVFVSFPLLFASCMLLATLFATLGRSWGALGVLLGQSWPLFGHSWAAVGPFWAALGPLLAALGPLLAALGALLGRSWPHLGRSWAALGRSWGALGRSWEALGPSWAALGTTCKNHPKIDAKNDRLGLPKASQMAPTSDQKTIKNRCKKRSENRTEKRPSWNRLGAILGRFGSPLGVIFIDFSLVFKAFREKSIFSKNIVSRAVLSPTWPILGRFWPPKCLQNGSQNGSKTIKKTC